MAPTTALPDPAPLRDDRRAATPTRTTSAELGVSLMHRLYEHQEETATGVRASLSVPLPVLPFLRARLDLGGDHIATPYQFSMLAGRAGLSVLARRDVVPRVAVEAGLRTEVLVGKLRHNDLIVLHRDWTAAWGAGVVAGTSLTLGAGLRLRVELAGELVLKSRAVVRSFVELPGSPADSIAPVTASAVLTVGLDVGGFLLVSKPSKP
jgi:hypothetical protein